MATFLLINFARPDKTKKSLKTLEDCKDLLLFCDGAKENTKEKTKKVQELLVNCAQLRIARGLKTELRFEEENLGPRKGPLTAIRWLFSVRDEGHIIEDDIIPAPGFEEAHNTALELIKTRTDLFCVGEGHTLPNCTSKWIPTRMARLVAWSSTKEKMQPLLEESENPLPWKEKKLEVLKGLHLKTQIFLWKEFCKLQKNPNWSWHYTLMQTQLLHKLQGLTPTTTLHKNIGIDGSGANRINLFGEYETFTATELENWKRKEKELGQDPKSERTMEWERYGRLHQSIGRFLYNRTPTHLKYLWRPTINS